MNRLMASLCLAVFMMAAPAVWAESSSAFAASEMTPLLATLEAAHASMNGSALEDLNPLQTAKQAAGGWDTSCCTQQEINDCFASVEPGSGCYVERITCYYYNYCWCQIFCY